mmetsp:Transcript_72119/g.192729  ORF Transcript_72119/g.192729 Transcript_72119/m.192729 type:complete len:571 (+) Transcript_72119:436-2148(+)
MTMDTPGPPQAGAVGLRGAPNGKPRAARPDRAAHAHARKHVVLKIIHKGRCSHEGRPSRWTEAHSPSHEGGQLRSVVTRRPSCHGASQTVTRDAASDRHGWWSRGTREVTSRMRNLRSVKRRYRACPPNIPGWRRTQSRPAGWHLGGDVAVWWEIAGSACRRASRWLGFRLCGCPIMSVVLQVVGDVVLVGDSLAGLLVTAERAAERLLGGLLGRQLLDGRGLLHLGLLHRHGARLVPLRHGQRRHVLVPVRLAAHRRGQRLRPRAHVGRQLGGDDRHLLLRHVPILHHVVLPLLLLALVVLRLGPVPEHVDGRLHLRHGRQRVVRLVQLELQLHRRHLQPRLLPPPPAARHDAAAAVVELKPLRILEHDLLVPRGLPLLELLDQAAHGDQRLAQVVVRLEPVPVPHLDGDLVVGVGELRAERRVPLGVEGALLHSGLEQRLVGHLGLALLVAQAESRVRVREADQEAVEDGDVGSREVAGLQDAHVERPRPARPLLVPRHGHRVLIAVRRLLLLALGVRLLLLLFFPFPPLLFGLHRLYRAHAVHEPDKLLEANFLTHAVSDAQTKQCA